MDEQRNFKRLDFYCHVEILTPNKLILGELIDISLTGALVATEERVEEWLAENEKCTLRLHMVENETILMFQAEMRHHFEFRSGYEFTEVDVDTITDLRRILEQNFGDADRMEREFQALIND